MSIRLKHPLAAFYAFSGLWSFNATSGLWILYLLHCHWSLFQVGLAEAGFHIVSFVSDVPTGMFADRFGRRRSLVFGLLIGALTPAMTFIWAPVSVGLGILSVSVGALSWTFIGGADQALLYGLTASQPNGLGYARTYGRMAGLSLSVTAIAIVTGGLLVSYDGWMWPYLITAGSNLIAVIPVLLIPQQQKTVPTDQMSQATFMQMLRRATKLVGQDTNLLLLVAVGAVVATLSTTNNLYAQAMLMHKGASLARIGWIIAIANGFTAVGSLIGGRVAQRRRRRRFGWGLGVYGTALAVVGVFPLPGAVSGYLLAQGVDGVIDPIYAAVLNEGAPEEYRATVLSLPGTGFSLGMIILFPIVGWLMGRGYWIAVYGTMGTVLILIGMMVLHSGRRSKSQKTTAMASK